VTYVHPFVCNNRLFRAARPTRVRDLARGREDIAVGTIRSPREGHRGATTSSTRTASARLRRAGRRDGSPRSNARLGGADRAHRPASAELVKYAPTLSGGHELSYVNAVA